MNMYLKKSPKIKEFYLSDVKSSSLSSTVDKKKGIYDAKRNVYVDLITKRVMSLEDAVDRGLAVLRQDKYQNKVNEGYQFLNITGILNPITRQKMSLNEAIESGLLDHAECEFRDPSSGKTLTLLEAYDRGFLLTTAKTYSAPVSASATDEQVPTEVSYHYL